MVEERRDTVVVDNDRRSSPVGWIVALVLVVLVILFLMNGGFGLFGGGNTTNVETPIQ